MADQDRELKRQARQLHNMFKQPGMVSPQMTEDLLRWIIERARTAATSNTEPERS